MYSQGGIPGGLRALNKIDPGPVGQRVSSKTIVILCMCAHSFYYVVHAIVVMINVVHISLLDIKHSLCKLLKVVPTMFEIPCARVHACTCVL